MELTGRKPLLLLALAGLGALFMFSPLQSGASRIDEVRQQLAQSRQKEQVLTGDISKINRKISKTTKHIDKLQAREAVVQDELNRKQIELQAARVRLKRLKLKLKRSQRVLAVRLIEIYKADEPDIVTVILQSDGFSDLVERVDFMSRIGEADSKVVDRVRILKGKAKKEKAHVQVAYDQVRHRREILADTRAGVQSQQASLADVKGQRADVLATTKKQSQRLEGDLAELEKANEQATSTLQNTQSAPDSTLPKSNGPLSWPVSGPIVSPFGMRWGRLHAGVDIAVPTGTPIHASAGGIVKIAGWVGGYGNYTCVQYSATNSYCNGHQSSIGVNVGQRVRRGQVIGRVGCTGHCFGPHTHFEVRINGSPVNPAPYL